MCPATPHSKKKTSSGQNPSPVDVYVGARLRMRRTTLDISQGSLAKQLGLTFQQIQKYENGTNRISASRLFDISQVLDIPISYFFDNFDGSQFAPEKSGLNDKTGQAEFEMDVLSRRETIELIRAYYQITNPELRKKILDFTRTLAETQK